MQEFSSHTDGVHGAATKPKAACLSRSTNGTAKRGGSRGREGGNPSGKAGEGSREGAAGRRRASWRGRMERGAGGAETAGSVY